MKYYLLFLFNQFLIVLAPIPNWDFNKHSFDLLTSSEKEYIIYKKEDYETTVTLKKKITKIDGIIKSTNYLIIGSETREVPFEDIDSHYKDLYGCNGPLICPKGKFHPYCFNNNVNITHSSEFLEKGDWDLRCYNHYTGHFLVFYFQNEYYNFYSKCDESTNDNGIKRVSSINSDIYDYALENGIEGDNHKYKFPHLKNDGGNLQFLRSSFIMNPNDANINLQSPQGEIIITELKQKTQAYFNSNYCIHYFTYNNVMDFLSGFSTNIFSYADILNYDSYSVSSISITKNERSPLSFLDHVEIKEIKFIAGTQYVYYKIENIDKEKFYYGLIDIELNKIVYNFDQEIIQFIPYLDKSNSNKGEMLAITPTSAYRICIVKTDSSCLTSCPNLNDIILDPDENNCDGTCNSGKIKLMPEGYCIKEELCNTSIYIKKSVDGEIQCGLCSYFNSDGNIYRLIGGDECLSNIPNNSENFNSYLYLLQCKNDYHIENNACVPDYCFERCDACSEISNNVNDQKCISCKSGFNLNNGNCEIIPTTIYLVPTTIITRTPTTNYISPSEVVEIPIKNCLNERCDTCSFESNKLKLCLTCDTNKYKKVNYTRTFSKYLDCEKESKLEYYFYKESETGQYKPCYEKCKKCSGPGNATFHNCLQCNDNYMFRPGDNPKNNCVVLSEFYYLSPYDEYKPLNNPQCPEEAKFSINNKETNKISCIFDCKVDKVYKYLYNGNCIKNCSEIEGTENVDFICKETDPNKIYISEKPIYLDTNDTINIIETLAITYAQEFNYTNKHISLFKNDEMTIAVYKDKNIIAETDLKIPNIDFGECYNKVKYFYNITEDNIIIAIADKKVKNNPSTFYLFFHPETGQKLEVGEICKNENIIVKENMLNMLNPKSPNFDLQVSLTKQGINIFDINDPYYKDLCYDYDNPKNKDMALKDRIKETFVNVTLCDDGCVNKGIDIKNNIATCDCKFNEVTDNDLIHENPALDYIVGEFFELINTSNILVLKCYKYIFKHFNKAYGGMIILSLLLLNIIFALLFFFVELLQMKRYIISLTEKYTSFLTKYPNLANFYPPKRSDNKIKNENVINFSNENKKHNIHQNNKSGSMRTINLISNSKQNIYSKDSIVYNMKKKSMLIPKQKMNRIDDLDKIDEGKILKKYFKEYLSTLPDDMEFDDAIKKDKRSFCEYFRDNLEENQSLAYTFIASDPINTRMIKLILFVLNIDLYFIISGLFFGEAYISELYHTNDEDENFFIFIPRIIDKIIYTTIVAVIVGFLTDFFFLDEKKVKGIFKREKENNVLLKRSIVLLINEIQKRYTSFIIMTFVIIVISLYYILCFNYVYPKTQIEWIKVSILIMIIMQILSFLKCLYEAIFRFLSFKSESEKLYKASLIFESCSRF